jgi:hypothetical protein
MVTLLPHDTLAALRALQGSKFPRRRWGPKVARISEERPAEKKKVMVGAEFLMSSHGSMVISIR